MEVRTADHLGMCFGVKDAIDLALRLTRQGPITILGDLVHNPDVVADLDSAGAFRAQQPGQVATRAVLLTAHGTSDRTKLQLREDGRQVRARRIRNPMRNRGIRRDERWWSRAWSQFP